MGKIVEKNLTDLPFVKYTSSVLPWALLIRVVYRVEIQIRSVSNYMREREREMSVSCLPGKKHVSLERHYHLKQESKKQSEEKEWHPITHI